MRTAKTLPATDKHMCNSMQSITADRSGSRDWLPFPGPIPGIVCPHIITDDILDRATWEGKPALLPLLNYKASRHWYCDLRHLVAPITQTFPPTNADAIWLRGVKGACTHSVTYPIGRLFDRTRMHPCFACCTYGSRVADVFTVYCIPSLVAAIHPSPCHRCGPSSLVHACVTTT